ncbi:histone-fold-containing protein [Curvularia clavata]|uniref:Histone-fold-containing protein n=1 Tax=Curvularia clavata TaxID=95742 RepID=A0A9Q9DSM9_CURCL|nr:histone-fold-containing protein [Curvularia clavata]
MSASPPKQEGVEPVQSPDEEQPMDRNTEENTGQIGYEFEVKEQDRWLPIANATQRSAVPGNSPTCSPAMSPSPPHSSTSPPQLTPKSSGTSPGSASASDANIRNFAPVARIMKMALPENAKIAKEAKECMQECVSEFISFITSEASEKCQQEKRKTVNGEDILFAMTSLGFENYSEALKIYLSRYRENKPPTGQFAAGSGGPNAGGPENQQHVLSGDSEMGDDSTAFGYPVHNGNGAEY